MSEKLSLYRMKKGILYLRHFGIRGFWVRFKERLSTSDREYDGWYQRHKPSEEELQRQQEEEFPNSPLISLVVPVYNTPEEYLKQMIDSVLHQTYPNWELCIANANPSNASVRQVLVAFLERDPRIKVVDVPENQGIAQNTNAALSIASGVYIGFLDHDDLLTKDALYEMVKKINENERWELLYSDEDKVTADLSNYFQPHFKPEFNLDLLRSNNYICHFCVIKKDLIDKCGGLRGKFNGAQDYDLILRCAEKAEGIVRIPRILYHWRVHPASTSDNPICKQYAYDAGKRAIEEHLKRCGEKALVQEKKDLGFYRVTYEVQGSPLVSIIIFHDGQAADLDKCLSSIQKSTYKNYEIIVAEKNQAEKIASVKGEYLLFLQSDVEVWNKQWLEELVANCQRKQVGVVGAKIYASNRTVQHAGMIVGMNGVVGNLFVGLPHGYSGYLHKADLQQNLSAVSGACMMVKRSVYESVGGFSESLAGGFYDVDFCLKVRQKGFLVVYDPYAELLSHVTVKSSESECSYTESEQSQKAAAYMKKRWSEIFETGDPMYNPNFSLEKGDYSLK